MPNAEMKTLTIGDTTYEIVDEEAREKEGDLSELNTQVQTDLVAAINEVAESSGVVSVNGMTGTVVLTAADVGAATTGALTDEATARTAADAQLQGQITALGNGAPIPVSTIAAMTVQTQVYLYTGTETGESTGYWYTYDSTQAKFVPRGEYGGAVTDTTLSISGQAADAKAVGNEVINLKSAISNVYDAEDNAIIIDRYFISSTGKWQAGAAYQSMAIGINPGDDVVLKNNSQQSAFYSFLKSFNGCPIHWQSPDYATGYTGYVSISAETAIIAPSDAHFLYVYKGSSDSHLPSKIIVNGFDMLNRVRDVVVGNTQDIQEINETASQATTDIRKIMTDDYPDGFGNEYSIEGGVWKKKSFVASWVVPVKANDVVVLHCSLGASYYTVLASNNVIASNGTPTYATGYSGVVSYSNPSVSIIIPEDGAYIWIYANNGVDSRIPDIFTINGYSMLDSLRDTIIALQTATTKIEETYTAKSKLATLTNILANGDFHTAGSPMGYTGCAGAVSNGVLTVTGDGTANNYRVGYYYPITNIGSHHYFTGLWVRANSNKCKRIKLFIAGQSANTPIENPVPNKWYYISVRYIGNDSANAAWAWEVYAYADSAEDTNGESISIKQATTFFIGSDFGIGADPALYKLMNLMSYNDYFWMGTKDAVIWKAEPPITKESLQKRSFGTVRRPMVTLIDDDGWQKVYDDFVGISEKYGIPFCCAIQINSTIRDWNVLYLQNELGWEMAVHPDGGPGGMVDKSEEYIVGVIEDTIDYLNQHGLRWENVVYANGEPDARLREIYKRYFQCGLAGSKVQVNYGVIANFEIQRVALGYPLSAEHNTFAHLKTYIDEAIENNGWCIFMTHVNQAKQGLPEGTTLVELVDELMDYCVNDCGIDVVTIKEGFEVFGNALECGDYLGRNARGNADPTTGVAISKTGALGNIMNIRTLDNLMSTLGTALNGTIAKTYNEETEAYTFTFSPSN